jgi:hypothetical protein
MQLGPGSHRPVSARQAFPPVYFAMVMATGIVSIAVYLNGMQRLAATLMWLNVVLFIAFWILLIGRLALAPRGLLEELTSFKLAPGFVTIVAGTSVLARQLLIIQADIRFPIAMFCFAFPVWASFIYLIFTAFKVKEDKPDLANGIHGGWHLSVVATQSVGMLAALLANQLAAYRQQLLFLSLALWLCGGMLPCHRRPHDEKRRDQEPSIGNADEYRKTSVDTYGLRWLRCRLKEADGHDSRCCSDEYKSSCCSEPFKESSNDTRRVQSECRQKQ